MVADLRPSGYEPTQCRTFSSRLLPCSTDDEANIRRCSRDVCSRRVPPSPVTNGTIHGTTREHERTREARALKRRVSTRTSTPGRSRNAVRSALITVRSNAFAVAAMIRSVRAAWPALGSNLEQELGVGLGDLEVVVEHGDRGDDVIDVHAPRHLRRPVARRAHARSSAIVMATDRDVVVVVDHIVEVVAGAFGVHKERRVEEDTSHDRSSILNNDRTSSSSLPRPRRSVAGATAPSRRHQGLGSWARSARSPCRAARS